MRGDSEVTGLALEHARAWFALHADQRLRALNFFLLAAAFLTTAYVTTFERTPGLAAAAGGAGFAIAFAFGRMEQRTRQLIKRGEEALAPLERQLAKMTSIDQLRLVENSERAAPFTSYRFVIGFLRIVAELGFAVGFAIAAVR